MSIVIPTIGRDVLEGCLTSIADGDTWPNRVLVVDQSPHGAASAPVDRLRSRGVDAVHVPMTGRGVARGTNHGIARVSTPLVAVTHDDCRVHRTWLRLIAGHVRNSPTLIVVTGRVLPEGGADVPSTITSTTPVIHTRPLWSRDVLFPASMAFCMEVWRRVGAMDEDPLLGSCEDNEWAYRILRAHIPIAYAPDVVVEHRAWRDDEALAQIEWTYARSQGAWYGKELRGRDPYFLVRLGSDLSHALWWRIRGRAARDRELHNRGRAWTTGLAAGLVAGFRRGGPAHRPVRGKSPPGDG